tara:strand:- start:12 stop:5864 length:5853 start_codon:yes stop_codon:yes gene_type:complete
MAFVGNIIGGAVDIVVDVVEDVVGVVGDAIDWVVDEIVEPVLSGVGDIIEAALDDPITTIVKVAAIATGNAWALPLIDGASVAAKGGDLGDVVKAAAISYATGKVAATTSKFVNPAIANANLNSTVELALQKGIEGGARSATAAVIYGQDPLKAFATGGLNAAVGATLGQVADKIDAKFDNFTDGIDIEGNPIIGGWEKLQDGVKDSITASITAELTGGEVSSTQLAGIIGKYSGVSETMSKFLSENTGLTDETAEVMTSALTNAATTALSGNPSLSSEAFFAKWDEYGVAALKALVDKPVNAAIDKVAGTSAKTESAANALNFALGKATDAADGFNGLRTELNGRVQEQERLKGVYNTAVDAFNANPSEETQNAANIASAAYNTHVMALEDDYASTYKPQMDAYTATYNEYNPQIEGLTDEYNEQTQYLMSDIDDLDVAMKPIFVGANKAAALTLRPGIDESKYRELNGLGAGEDVYAHYLANQAIAEVFDVNQLNAEAKSGDGADPYGEGYTSEIITVKKTNAYDGSTYDEEVLKYYVDTPDGKVEVDPYLEGVGGGRGGDPRDFNNGVWTMQDYRTSVAPPVTLGGRFTYDMASIVGDTSKQGQIITLNDFKKLKDAGYNITPFKDKFTGETINGNQSYDDVVANYMQERARNPQYEKPVGYEPVDFMGYTEVSQDLHNDVVGYWKSTGLSDADARARAEQTAPVGSILNENSKFSDNSSLKDLVDFRDYIDNLEVGDEYKYSFNENYNDIMIAEATRLVGDEAPSTLEAFLRNTSGLGLDAIGQLAQTMSYATILTNAAGLTDTNAEDTWLNSFGEILSDAGTNIQTDEYRDKVKNLNEDMAKAMADSEGVGGTLKAILGVAWDNPTAFVSEYIVSEIFQELPLLLASGGTSVLLKGGATVAAKAVGTEFAETTLKRIGFGAAMTTAVGTNVAEGFGGAAQDGYEKGLATYNKVEFENLRAKGLSVGEARAALETPAHLEKAEQYATELAEQAGLIGGGLALITAGLGSKIGIPDNLALEKALFGDKKAPAGFIDQLKDYAKTISAETVAEGGEEGGINAFIEGRLSLIDPTRDVSGNIAAAAFLGAIAGGGTAGGIRVGNDIINVGKLGTDATVFLTTSPPSVLSELGIGSFTGPTVNDNSGAGDINAFNDPPPIQTLIPKLADLGLSADSQLDLANIVHNSQVTTKEEVKKYAQLENPEFDFTGDNATNAYNKFVGAKSDADLATEVAAYIDPLYTTYAEAIAVARAEGVTLTEAQVEDYVGKPEDDVEDEINDEYDADYTSREEAAAGFARQNGYTPTDAELDQFVGATPDSELDELLFGYVDPRQTTEAEARKFFTDQNYEPTDAEVTERVGQGGEAFETDTKTGVDSYVDPRQVTDAEARQFFEDLGYSNPTDEQVAQFVAQVEETTQQDVISKYVDPRQVTRDELQTIADEEGLTLTDALAAAYVGQGEAENFQTDTLDTARTEYDPLATTVDEATQFFADTNYTATAEEIAEFVASKTEEVQTSAIGAYVDPRQMTSDEAREFLSEVGYNPTDEEVADFTGQLNDDSYQVTQKTAIDEYVDPRFFDAGEVRAAYEELGLVDVTQEDVDRFVGQYDPESEDEVTEFETSRLDELGTYLPEATFNVIKGVLGSPAVADDPNTDADESKDATGIYAEFEAGVTRDEALQSAIDKLTTDLGLTEDAMLTALGLTKEELSSEIDLVAADVVDIKEDVEGVKEDIAAVETNLGDDIQAVADLVGKPARDVTQTDIDFVIDLIAQENVSAELITQYDVTGDGIVDINDQTMLETSLQGEENVTLADTSMFNPATGLYLQQEQDTQSTQDLMTELNTQLNTNINTQSEALAQQAQDAEFRRMRDAGMFEGAKLSATTPDPMNIDYLYDFESIFANPAQEGLFDSPYGSRRARAANQPANPVPRARDFAQGGQVEDENDMLLRILGDM